MRNLSLLVLTSLASCTSVAPAAPVPPADACLPVTLDQFIGQRQSTELSARMLGITGKTALRWVRPGMAVTMDYREDRLTVYLDAGGKVERATCG